VALLVYVLNKGKYHPLVRPAWLTSALGYSLAGISVVIDLGRPGTLWKVPLSSGDWNLNSIAARGRAVHHGLRHRAVDRALPGVHGALEGEQARLAAKFAERRPSSRRPAAWLIALGLLLPTMHQSSLGSLMLLAGPKLHPLWHALLPLLFLVSCARHGLRRRGARVGARSQRGPSSRRSRPRCWRSRWAMVAIVTSSTCSSGSSTSPGAASSACAFTSGGWLLFWAEIALFLTPDRACWLTGAAREPGSATSSAPACCWCSPAASTASTPPVTRIEGHLRIDVEVDGGKVKKAWSSGQMWRGIEKILKGRDPRDAWLFTQRICGVCTTVHAITSVRAVENALQLEIPVNAQYIRNMIIAAHAIHDHIVHFYHLSALDWVDVVSALKADPDKAAQLAESLSDWPATAGTR
jgi:formate-dependent nitrite reductase membrane component NrfD